MNLVPAQDGNLADIVALMNRAFRGTESWNAEEGYIAGDRIRLTDLREDLAAKPLMRLMLCRDDAGLLLGCFSLEPADTQTRYLGMLTVRPDQQDQKLGRRLLDAAEDMAKASGASRMRMSVVWVREPLIAWYQRRGYALTGETAPFPYGDNRWGRPLRDDLHFVMLEKSL
jgi:ribosomal protein S18 acetylase RimI-like enzyme